MTKTKLVFIAMALALVAWVGASAASAQDGPSLTADPATVTEAGEYTFNVTGTGFTVDSLNATVCPTANQDEITETNFTSLCGLGFGNTVTKNDDGTFTAQLTAEVGADGITLVMFQLAAGGESARLAITISEATADDSADDAASDDTADDSADDAASDDTADDDTADDDTADDDTAEGDTAEGDDSADDAASDDSGDDGDDMGDGDDTADDSADDAASDDTADDDTGEGDDTADDAASDDSGDDGDDMGDGDDTADDDMMPATGSNTSLLAIIALAVVLAGAMVLGLSRRLRTQ